MWDMLEVAPDRCVGMLEVALTPDRMGCGNVGGGT